VQPSREQSRNFDFIEMTSLAPHPMDIFWHTRCDWRSTMNSIFYIIGVVVVIVVILKLLGLF